MKISKRKNKKYTILTAIIFIIIALVLCLMYFNNAKNSTDTTPNKVTTSSDSININKSSNNSEKTNSAQSTNKKEIKNIEGTSPQETENLSGIITYSGIMGQILVIRTNIDQLISDGDCKLKLSSNTIVLEKQSSIINNPSSSTCDGFNIPLSELQTGDWDIKITISGNNKSGTIKGKASI